MAPVKAAAATSTNSPVLLRTGSDELHAFGTAFTARSQGSCDSDVAMSLDRARQHPVLTYFALAFALSWAVWIPMAVMELRVRQGVAWPTHVPGLFGPLAAAFIMTGLIGKRRAVRDLITRMLCWRVAPRWYLAAFSPLAFFVIGAAASFFSGQGWPRLDELGKFSGLPAVSVPLMWLLLVVTGYAEETGWRGFAVPQLQQRHSMLATAATVGILWPLWHVPSMLVLQNYRELGLAVLPAFFLGILAGSVLLTWLYNVSGGSIFIVTLWHANYNLAAGTAAAHGLVAAVVSTGVMVWAAAIALSEARRMRRTAGPETQRDAAAAASNWSRRLLHPFTALGVAALALAAYFAAIYPWFMSWGATKEEQQMTLPGDTISAASGAYFTRAITVNAPAATVWSWVIQIGQDRAGFYSNTWLENLGGNDIHNADEIRTEWQLRAIGDRVPMARTDMAAIVGDSMYLKIDALQPGVMIDPLPGRFVLQSLDANTTRLLLREPLATGVFGRTYGMLQWDPLHFVMEQRMLQGIKERAEGEPLVAPQLILLARIGWALAGAAVLGLFVTSWRRGRWLPLPVLAALPAILLGDDWHAGLTAFIGTGAILLGALAFGGRGRLVSVVAASASLLFSMLAPLGVTIFGAIAWGKRWPAFVLLSCAVLLLFIFSPDAYSAFGLLFTTAAAVACAAALARLFRGRFAATNSRRPG